MDAGEPATPEMRGWLTLKALTQRPASTFAAVGIAFAALYLAAFTLFPRSHGRIIAGDAIQYYAYLRSMVIDHDLDFTNDYGLLYGPDGDEGNVWLKSRTPAGRPTNLMSVGPALLWSPFFAIAYVAVASTHLIGGHAPLDGMTPVFPLSVGIAGIAYATFGAYLCYRAARLLYPDEPGLWAALIAWLATPALYYSVVSPSYSHATSLFACALFGYAWLRSRDDFGLRRYVWLGALAGLAALVRWQDIIVMILPSVDLSAAVLRRRLPVIGALGRGAAMFIAAAAALLPQLIAWRSIYGSFVLMPQGQGFMQWTSPALFSVLFSTNHGLFTWTPAVLLAVAGLVLLARRDGVLGSAVCLLLLIAVYVNASVTDWWAGEAFGARRFVSCTVLFALGLAAFFSIDFWRRRPVLRRWTALGVVAYNLLFLLQYQLFMRGYDDLVPYPTTVRQILLDRLALPWVLLRAWLS
jgi:hypothetical protein